MTNNPLKDKLILKLHNYVLSYRDINLHCFIPITLNITLLQCVGTSHIIIFKDSLHLLTVDSHLSVTK